MISRGQMLYHGRHLSLAGAALLGVYDLLAGLDMSTASLTSSSWQSAALV